MPERDFAEIEQRLEHALLRLKRTKDPKSKRDLLRELRLLLVEADRVIHETSGPATHS